LVILGSHPTLFKGLQLKVILQAHMIGALQYVKSGLDPTTVAVMLEDGGAVAGLAIAGGQHLGHSVQF